MSVKDKMTALANAIRAKTGSTEKLTLDKMVIEVNSITVGSTTILQEKTLTPTKAKQEATADTGYNGLSKVTVNPIPDEYVVPSGTLTNNMNNVTFDVTDYAKVKVAVPIKENRIITANGVYDAADEGYEGFATVEIDVPTTIPEGYVKPSGRLDITENNETRNCTNYAEVAVNIPIKENKIITANGVYDAADEGYDGYGTVEIDVPIPSGYIKPSGDLGITQNGKYDATQYKSVTVNVEQGGNTAKLGTKTVTTYAKETVLNAANDGLDGYSSVELIYQEDTETVTPTKATQTVKPSSGTVLSQVTVNPIPNEYIVPSGRLNITKPVATQNCTNYAEVSVNVPIKDNKIITANGVYDASGEGYEGFATVEIDVPSEDISTEIATQKQLISQIKTALEGKAAGGGASAPTLVPLTVRNSSPNSLLMAQIRYMTYQDGEYVAKTEYVARGTSGTVNCAPGSLVAVTQSRTDTSLTALEETGVEVIYSPAGATNSARVYLVTGESASITLK